MGKQKTVYLPEYKYNRLKVVKEEYERRIKERKSWGDFLMDLTAGTTFAFIADDLRGKNKKGGEDDEKIK